MVSYILSKAEGLSNHWRASFDKLRTSGIYLAQGKKSKDPEHCREPTMSCTLVSNSDEVRLLTSPTGKSLVAARNIAAGKIVIHLAGSLVSKPSKYSIQISETTHLESPMESLHNYIDHSCDPVSYIDWEMLNLVSVKGISEGEKITYNYCTSEWDMVEKFECDCRTAACLGIIGGAKYLTDQQRKRIVSYVSPFLLDKLGLG